MRSHLASWSLAALVLLGSTPALAYERQWHAGASAGYIGGWNGLGHGFGAGVDLSYGIRDWFALSGALDVSYHPSSKLVIPTAAVGGRVSFDVLQVVPWIGLHVGIGTPAGAKGCSGVGCVDPRFDLAIPFGVDYSLSRKFTVGLAGKFQLLAGRGPVLPMMGAFARVQYVWGY